MDTPRVPYPQALPELQKPLLEQAESEEGETIPKKKPIKVFYSQLTGKLYASQHYRKDGPLVTITGEKFDVTTDIGAIVKTYNLQFKARPCIKNHPTRRALLRP